MAGYRDGNGYDNISLLPTQHSLMERSSCSNMKAQDKYGAFLKEGLITTG